MNFNRFSFLAAAAMAAVAASAAAGAKTVRAGIEAWQRSDYAAAVAIWTPLAEKGDADAAFNLGQAYRLGRGVPVNLATAKRWLEKAARADHTDAQTTLGLLLFDSGDRAEAMQWLEKAAERGEPRAMLVYGTALFNGDAVKRDPLRAYAYVSRAAAQGLAPAKATLEELDALLPVDVRRKGVELAQKKAAKNAPPPSASKPKTPTSTTAATASSAASKAKAAEAKPAATNASAESPTGGKWRIQLGAFSKRSSAEALYGKLSASPPVAGRAAAYVPAGAIVRLQVGGFASKSAAAAACAALSAKGQACFPVAPN